jgi:hypothetical protein
VDRVGRVEHLERGVHEVLGGQVTRAEVLGWREVEATRDLPS